MRGLVFLKPKLHLFVPSSSRTFDAFCQSCNLRNQKFLIVLLLGFSRFSLRKQITPVYLATRRPLIGLINKSRDRFSFIPFPRVPLLFRRDLPESRFGYLFGLCSPAYFRVYSAAAVYVFLALCGVCVFIDKRFFFEVPQWNRSIAPQNSRVFLLS